MRGLHFFQRSGMVRLSKGDGEMTITLSLIKREVRWWLREYKGYTRREALVAVMDFIEYHHNIARCA